MWRLCDANVTPITIVTPVHLLDAAITHYNTYDTFKLNELFKDFILTTQ